MAFDDLSQAGAGSRYRGEGFRQEPDFRSDPAATMVGGPAPVDGDATVPVPGRVAAPNLDYVFDDPAEGEPGRDRMLVHGLWEAALAVIVVVLGYLLYREDPQSLTGNGLRTLLVDITVVGALGVAWAASLRAGVANLAVGAVAAAAAVNFAQHANGGLARPLLVIIGLCAVIGAALGLVVAGLQVPSWAASLGVVGAVALWSSQQVALTPIDGYDPRTHAYWWFGGLCAISVVAGLAGLFPTVRRGIGRFRSVADPAQRRGVVAALVAVGATVVSVVLAGVAGVLSMTATGNAIPSDGLNLTVIGLGVALLGGVSAFGRRGGVFGTVLAAIAVSLLSAYADALGERWSQLAVGAVAVAVGLVLTRLVERFGRPAPSSLSEDDDEWLLGGDPDQAQPWPAGTGTPLAAAPVSGSRAYFGTPGGTSLGQTSGAGLGLPAQGGHGVPPSAGLGGIWTPDQAWGSAGRR